MPMKIALVIERFNIALGGAERSVYEITEQLAKMGQEVTILASVASAGVDSVIALCGNDPDKRISFEVYCAALDKHLKTTVYDIVHSTLPIMSADVYQPMGGSYVETYIRNAASYPNKLVSAFKRVTFFTNAKRMQYIRAERQLCLNSTVTIAALSRYVKDQFKQHYNLPDDRLAMTPNAVETELEIDIQQSKRNEQTIISELRLERNSTMLLLFGANNFRLKGLHDLLTAAAAFKRKKPSQRIALIVAGSGRQTAYRALARKLKIDRDLYFTGYTNAIQNYLAICDVAVLPSYYDPCSRFILEGLAIAKPVMTTRYNGASEFYQHLRHGIVLDEPDNIEQFVEGLEILSQVKKRREMSDAIRQDNLKQTVSIKAHCNALMRLYQSIYARKQNK